MKSISMFLIVFSALAGLPSVESLFRHGANAEISLNTVKLEFSVEQMDLSTGEPVIKEGTSKSFFTMYFSKDASDNIDFIQMSSDRKIGDDTPLNSFFYKRSFVRYQAYQKESLIERDIFYSLLSTIALNESRPFASLLKKTDSKFKSNKDVINREKVALLKQYKNYLATIKLDPEAEATLENPLRPENEQEKLKINEIMGSSMYLNNEHLKLEKKGQNFRLSLKLENYLFNFTNEGHQFVNFAYSDPGKNLSMHFKQFILFNGTHQLPRKIIYRIGETDTYLISFLSLSHFNVTPKFYRKKVKSAKSMVTAEPTLTTSLPFMYY